MFGFEPVTQQAGWQSLFWGPVGNPDGPPVKWKQEPPSRRPLLMAVCAQLLSQEQVELARLVVSQQYAAPIGFNP
jgi:hypothetical protein